MLVPHGGVVAKGLRPFQTHLYLNYERAFPPLVLSPLIVSTIKFKCHQSFHHLPETGYGRRVKGLMTLPIGKQRGKHKKV